MADFDSLIVFRKAVLELAEQHGFTCQTLSIEEQDDYKSTIEFHFEQDLPESSLTTYADEGVTIKPSWIYVDPAPIMLL